MWNNWKKLSTVISRILLEYQKIFLEEYSTAIRVVTASLPFTEKRSDIFSLVHLNTWKSIKNSKKLAIYDNLLVGSYKGNFTCQTWKVSLNRTAKSFLLNFFDKVLMFTFDKKYHQFWLETEKYLWTDNYDDQSKYTNYFV